MCSQSSIWLNFLLLMNAVVCLATICIRTGICYTAMSIRELTMAQSHPLRPLINGTFQSHVFTFCCGSGPPPPGSCQGWGPWCWGTCCCRRGTSCPPPGRFGACGMGRVSAGSSQRSPSLHQHAPSRACCAASAERNRIIVSLVMSVCQRRALNGCSWALIGLM